MNTVHRIWFMCVLAGMLLMVACTPKVTETKTPPKNKIDNSSAEITSMTQEYEGDNIAEILMISYDGSQPALEEYGFKNPEIESLNNSIKFGIQQVYNTFMEQESEQDWIEIRSYPFTSENYLQIVTTSIVYPNYGTDGDITSYNFNKTENRFVGVDEVLADLQLSTESLTETVKNTLADVESVGVQGFLVKENAGETLTQLLLEVTLAPEGADAWKYFYGYTPTKDALVQLDAQCLFDPARMDQMDPPLSYQQITKGSSQPQDAIAITIDTAGMETVGHDMYALDQTVFFSIYKLGHTEYSAQEVQALITALEEGVSGMSCVEDAKMSAKLTYPVWSVTYRTGANEDTNSCTDIVLQTDTNTFRLHVRVPVDLAEEYADAITERIQSLHFLEV